MLLVATIPTVYCYIRKESLCDFEKKVRYLVNEMMFREKLRD